MRMSLCRGTRCGRYGRRDVDKTPDKRMTGLSYPRLQRVPAWSYAKALLQFLALPSLEAFRPASLTTMIELFILAVALSMDAFAVALGLGSKHPKNTARLALQAALYFGLFQGAMPVVGYLAGLGLASVITAIDHWVAFGLLSAIGGKMLYESFGEPIEDDICQLSQRVLLTLAIATSIDAMAAGFTLTLMSPPLWVSVLTIGVITFAFSYLGVRLGARGGTRYEKKAEVVGGLVLILIGVKILIHHTLLSAGAPA